MADTRLQRLAQVLVRYSLGIKNGDRFAIYTGPTATPLVQELVRESLRAGGLPEIFVDLPGVGEIVLKEGSDEQLSYIPAVQRMVYEQYETMLALFSQENTKELSGVDPSRMAIVSNVRRDLLHTYMQRTAAGLFRWCVAMYPTNAYAQDANMSLSDFEDFVYRACCLDDPDPVARWQELSRQQERLVQWLNGRHTIHLHGQDTDLTFSVSGRTFINSDGHFNFPDGEFFTGPVEDSANGYIRYSFSASFGGRSVEDLRLRFENCVDVEALSGQSQDYLVKMIRLY